jgi:hypothetical protein
MPAIPATQEAEAEELRPVQAKIAKAYLKTKI